ncbi:hypothetical protein AC1031_014972 [Aphanomyces cochlioides]|nr:hypothetical protein AC1031_014972 [Aphanomyces cochlioides]
MEGSQQSQEHRQSIVSRLFGAMASPAPGLASSDGDASDVDDEVAATQGPVAATPLPFTPEVYQHGPFADTQQRPSIAVASMGVPSPIREHDHVNPPEIPPQVDQSDDVNGPQPRAVSTAPTPPTYNGTMSQEKKAFMRAYHQYWFQCASLHQLGYYPVVMPVGACVSDVRRRTIAKFELRKPADQISEQEWREYFHKANEVGIIDYARVDRAMKNLRLNTSLTNAPSRVAKLLHQLTIQLEQLSMESFLETEQKRVVGYLVAALAPPTFKATVCDELGANKTNP